MHEEFCCLRLEACGVGIRKEWAMMLSGKFRRALWDAVTSEGWCDIDTKERFGSVVLMRWKDSH